MTAELSNSDCLSLLFSNQLNVRYYIDLMRLGSWTDLGHRLLRPGRAFHRRFTRQIRWLEPFRNRTALNRLSSLLALGCAPGAPDRTLHT